jgi:hypothetical protein
MVLLAPKLAHGQQQYVNLPDCQRSFSFTAAGNGLDFDNRTTACTTWYLVYQSSGFSVVSIEFQAAPDLNQAPGTYATWPNLASGALPLTSTVGGSITGYKYQPWVRVKLNTATGTGQLNGTLVGYRPFAGQDATAFGGGTGAASQQVQGTAATGASPVGNPVYIAGLDNGNLVRPLRLDSSGDLPIVAAIADADGIANNPSGQPVSPTGISGPLQINNHYFNGTTWDRMRGDTSGMTISNVNSTLADAANNATKSYGTAGGAAIQFQSYLFGFNGTTWDRLRTAALTNFATSVTTTARNAVGGQINEFGSRFTVNSAPAAGSQATASIAAEAAVRHVATGICFSSGSTTAPVLTSLQVNLRDGATGAGTVLASFEVEIPAATGVDTAPFCTQFTGGIVGTTNTAMTAEWSASLANLKQTATLIGYNIN